MFQTKLVEKIKTHILCSVTFPRKSYRLQRNVGKCGTATQATDGDIIQRMSFACWITKHTDTHSEYVTLIVFPLQQWLCERVSILRNQCITCLRFVFKGLNIDIRIPRTRPVLLMQHVFMYTWQESQYALHVNMPCTWTSAENFSVSLFL